MKKRFSLLLLTFMLGATVFAQEGARVGFRATPLISFANIVDSTKTKPAGLNTNAKLGFSFDFIFTYGFSESIGLMTGINISSRGFKYDQSVSVTLPFIGTTTTSIDVKTSFTAVDIPLGLKFRSPEIGDGIYVVGNFGVHNEINVQNKTVSNSMVSVGGIVLSDTTITTRDASDINLYTLSFSPGVGVNLETDFGMLEGMVTYHWGLLSFYKKDEGSGYIGKLNAIALSLGYYF
jgi:Outer membrane protein beta-barrel domain